MKMGTRLDFILKVLGIALLLVQGVIVVHQAVDLPLADEWEFFLPGALGPSIHADWLVSLHNEHRIVFTKLMAWFMLHATHLNFAAWIGVNFALYIGICALLVRLLRFHSSAPTGIVWVFLATGILWEVHIWAFLSQFHFYAAFFIASLFFVQRRDRWSWLALPLACASAYSFAAGFFCGLTVAAISAALAWLRPEVRLRHGSQAVLTAGAVATWLLGFHKNPNHPAFEPPWRWPFWRQIGATFGRAIGLKEDASWLNPYHNLGVALGLFLFATLLFLCVREVLDALQKRNLEKAVIRVGYIAGLMLGVFATATARAGFAGGVPVASRYLYPMVLLLPMMWVLTYEHILKHSRTAVAGVGFLLLVFLSPTMDFNRYYRPTRFHLQRGRQCVGAYYAGIGGRTCPDAYPFDLGSRLDRARELNASFVDISLRDFGREAQASR